MLNPSYSSLIRILNEDAGVDERITSRYSVVIAAAKRARQIVGGADHSTSGVSTDKAVSIAVNEIQHGNIKIMPGTASAWEIGVLEQFPGNIPAVLDDTYVSDEAHHGGSYDDFDDNGEVDDDYDLEDNDFDDSDDDWAEDDDDSELEDDE